MKDPYKSPNSNLVKETGIDGKTCPQCKHQISLMVMLFKTLVPNRFKCPNCGLKLKHDISPKFNLFFFLIFSSYCFLSLIFINRVLELSGAEKRDVYILIAIVPGLIVGIGFSIYFRVAKVLVRR